MSCEWANLPATLLAGGFTIRRIKDSNSFKWVSPIIKRRWIAPKNRHDDLLNGEQGGTQDYWRAQHNIISSGDKARKLPAAAEHTGGLYFGIFQEHPWEYFPKVYSTELFALSFQNSPMPRYLAKSGIHQGSPPEFEAVENYWNPKINWRDAQRKA